MCPDVLMCPRVLIDPVEVEAAGDEGVGIRHLLDHLAGGFSRPVTRLGVHVDKEGVGLAGPATDHMLQGGDVLQRVQGNHAVVMVTGQQQHSRVLHAVTLGGPDVV